MDDAHYSPLSQDVEVGDVVKDVTVTGKWYLANLKAETNTLQPIASGSPSKDSAPAPVPSTSKLPPTVTRC